MRFLKNNLVVLCLVTFFTILGGILRFSNNTNNPVSLNIDEVSSGYSAYSILKTGKDEYGRSSPFSFESTGDYKSPVTIYLAVPSIALFGLNEFAIRFPTALLATLSIPVFYLLLLSLTSNKNISLVSTGFLSISPWHIYYSRYESEHLIALFLMMVGIIFLFKMVKGSILGAIGASIFLVLSMYTYHSEKFFVPFFVLVFLKLYFKQLKNYKWNLLVFFLIIGIMVFPLAWSIISGPDTTRAQMTFITNDINFTRNVVVRQLQYFSGITGWIGLNFKSFDSDLFLLFFYWVRKLLYYLHPGYLFSNSLGMTAEGINGLGIVYFFELPFLVSGAIILLKNRINNYKLILAWLLIGLIPASLTQNEQHPGRTFLLLPMIVLISALGAVNLYNYISTKLTKKYQLIIGISFLVLVLTNLIQAYLIYTVHFPKQKSEDFMYGSKQSVEYIISHQDQYKEIVYDPYRGIMAPDIFNIPSMYILFYSKFDPLKYQTIPKRIDESGFKFDKYTIRRIDWREDCYKYDTLFVGSPWSLPMQDVKENEILEKIYLSNDKLALLVVSPKRKDN